MNRLKFTSANKAIQYLSDYTSNRVVIAAPTLKNLLSKLSKKYNIEESKIIELAEADPTYKGNPESSQSKNINAILDFYTADKNLDINKTKELIKQFRTQIGSGKIKRDTKLPGTLKELQKIVQNDNNLVLHGEDKFKDLKLIDKDGQYRLFYIDESEDWSESCVFAKHSSDHPWCVKEERHFNNYIPMYLFTKGNEFYALLSEKGEQFHNTKETQDSITKEEFKPIKNLVLMNNLKNIVLETDAANKLKYELMTEEEKLKDPSLFNLAIKNRDKETIKKMLNAGFQPFDLFFGLALETKDKEIIQMILDSGYKLDEKSVRSAVYTKDAEIVKMILDAGAKPDDMTLFYAIKTNEPNVVKEILNTNIKPDSDIMEYATKHKNKEIIDMIQNAMEKEPALAFDSANKAIQYLSDYTENRIVIAENDSNNIPKHLYHATYKHFLPYIKKIGLTANPPQKNWEDSKNLIYLATTKEIAESYAETSKNIPFSNLKEVK